MRALKFIGKRLLSYLFRGMLISIPLVVTAYIVITVLGTIDHLVPSELFGREVPGLGILSLLLFFIVLGWLGGTFIAQPLIKYFNKLIDQIPLVKTLYNSVKDFLSAFVGQKKSFNVPVLITIDGHQGIQQVGFLTAEDLTPMGLGPEKVAVYVPLSFSVAGNVYIVDRSKCQPLHTKAPDAMKFVVSGGVSQTDKHEEEPAHEL
ncbi:MAG TPA: DUF502 domain-containing protein [Luteibaculaceae bacterium]|nr:DUF502 domain-containing protein [Luteibaculaceae bacterium]